MCHGLERATVHTSLVSPPRPDAHTTILHGRKLL
jgi:hypothetical protein